MLKYCIILLGISLTFSCEKKVKTDLVIVSKTNDEKVLPDVKIHLNNEIIGSTGASGIYKETFEFLAGEKYNIKLVKPNKNYYYSGYEKDFTVDSDISEPITINATLYRVPKPNMESSSETSATETPKASSDDDTKTNLITSTEVDEKLSIRDFEEKSIEDKTSQKNATETSSEPKPSTLQISSEDLDDNENILPTKSVDDDLSEPETLFASLHVKSQTRPLSGVTISRSDIDNKSIIKLCDTDKDGRCDVNLPRNIENKRIKFLLQKEGYVTKTLSLKVSHNDILKFQMYRGVGVDVYALKNTYGFETGIAGLDVFLDGKKIGKTNSLGHIYVNSTKQKKDRMLVSIKSHTMVPQEYEHEFIASDEMHLKKLFSSKRPARPRIFFLPVEIYGTFKSLSASTRHNVDQYIKIALRDINEKKQSFKFIDTLTFEKTIPIDESIYSFVTTKGWKIKDISREVDAVLVPVIQKNKRSTNLMLKLVKADGSILSAAKMLIKNIDDQSEIDKLVEPLYSQLVSTFPFEGSITEVKNNLVTFNLGYSNNVNISEGDHINIFGTQWNEQRNESEITKVATAKINRIDDLKSVAVISQLDPKSQVAIGDMVQINSTIIEKKGKFVSLTVSNSDRGPVKNVSIYKGNEWIGVTDELGRFSFRRSEISDKNITFTLVKSGHATKSVKIGPNSSNSVSAVLPEKYYKLSIDSRPSGAEVYINNKLVGTTPLSESFPKSGNMVEITLVGGKDYKRAKVIKELDAPFINLMGKNAIVFEKDFFKLAKLDINNGETKKAMERLETVPKEHSDYNEAQHLLGEIYFNVFDEPDKASKAFMNVLSDKSVANYNNKKFISTHVNYGLSLFKVGETMAATNMNLAMSYFKKSIDKLNEVTMYLKYLDQKEYQTAKTLVLYHVALAKHKIWQQNPEEYKQFDSMEDWQKMLTSKGIDQESPYYKNAQIYQRQIIAQKNNRRGTEL